MPKKVPRKNVDPMLVDVRRPDFNYGKAADNSHVDLKRFNKKYSSGINSGFKNLFLKGGVISLVLGFLLFTGIAFANFQDVKVTVEREGESAASNFFDSLEAIKSGDTGRAESSLRESKQNLDQINKALKSGTSEITFNTLSSVVPLFKNAGGFLKELTSLNGDLLQLAATLDDLKKNGFNYFKSNGDKLINELNRSKDLVSGLRGKIENLRNKSSSLKEIDRFKEINGLINNYHLGYASDLYALNDFLDSFISLLDSKENERILLMFQNSSEMRPSGGFLGSYGELVFRNGQMKNLKVEDIYWPDHSMNFDLNLIPPQPLQRITRDWGARDANWFADFPTSAETVMSLLESSKIYKEKGVKFEGAVAINVKVLESIMEIIGPVDIEEYNMEINKDNFLFELQKEVETGKDKQQGKNPKKILAVLAPEIMSQLESLTPDQKASLAEKVADHISGKDIMFYSRNKNIAQFLKRVGVDGSVYQPSEGDWGNYLSVVNANVAGGKTDAFINQNINLQLNVSSDGSVLSNLSIYRKHDGDKREEPWYDTENKNYLKILTPAKSELMMLEGSDSRYEIQRDYSDEYRYYEEVQSLEESRVYLSSYNTWETREFGKTGFAAWDIVLPGEESQLNFRYESPPPQNFDIESEDQFSFVFDKQSGSNTNLNLNINAPLGYVWKESDSSVYTYESQDPEKRVKINLTLEEKDE